MIELKEYDYVPTQTELLNWINNLKRERDRALVSCLYLTGARINEILNKLKAEHIEIVRIEGDRFVIFKNIITEKKRNKKSQRRNIPVILDKNKENEFWKILNNYMKQLPSNKPIFNMTSTRAYQIINAWLKLFKETTPKKKKSKRKVSFFDGCHYLRHVRNTHLATLYDYSEFDLKKHNNWSSTQPAAVYTHLKVGDLVSKLKKA